MKSKPNRAGLCPLVIAAALGIAAQANAAGASQGLRLVSSQWVADGQGVQVETRISRSLANRVLAPRQLRVALLAADGSVRIEQRKLIGPAQMSRRDAGDFYLSTRLDVAPGPQERVDVSWVTDKL